MPNARYAQIRHDDPAKRRQPETPAIEVESACPACRPVCSRALSAAHVVELAEFRRRNGNVAARLEEIVCGLAKLGCPLQANGQHSKHRLSTDSEDLRSYRTSRVERSWRP